MKITQSGADLSMTKFSASVDIAGKYFNKFGIRGISKKELNRLSALSATALIGISSMASAQPTNSPPQVPVNSISTSATTQTIKPALQKLLYTMSDVTAGGAIIDVLINSSSLLTTYNDLAEGKNGVKRLVRIDYNPDPDDITGGYNRNTSVLHVGLGAITKSTINRAIDPLKLSNLMGHAGQHEIYANTMAVTKQKFDDAVNKMAASGGDAPHDYTNILKVNQEATLLDEGKADIAGWNAAVQYHAQTLGHPLTKSDIGAVANDLKILHFFDAEGNIDSSRFAVDPENPGQILATDASTVSSAAAQIATMRFRVGIDG